MSSDNTDSHDVSAEADVVSIKSKKSRNGVTKDKSVKRKTNKGTTKEVDKRCRSICVTDCIMVHCCLMCTTLTF